MNTSPPDPFTVAASNSGAFPLRPGEWYHLELTDHGECFPSPIRVDSVKRGARGRLTLGFWHQNYPAGVQDKVYVLRITAESPDALEAESLEVKERRVKISRALPR